MLEVVADGEVFGNSIFVVDVLLVFQRLPEVLPVGQVSFSLVLVEDALGGLVVRAVLVRKRFLQVLGVAKVLNDGVAMELVFLVNESTVVSFDVLELLSSSLPELAQAFLMRGQINVLRRGAVPMAGLKARGVGRQRCLRSRRGGGGLRGLGGSLQKKKKKKFLSHKQ